jgi:hypothetical protein
MSLTAKRKPTASKPRHSNHLSHRADSYFWGKVRRVVAIAFALLSLGLASYAITTWAMN